MTDFPKCHEYIVVFKAPAAVRFEENSCLKVSRLKTSLGFVEVTFATRYDNGGLEASIPRELWVEARGNAKGLNAAINDFGTAVSRLIPVFAVTENAAILELKTHLAFDNTPGTTEREFFQSFHSDERGMPRISIKANPKVLAGTFECINHVDTQDVDRVLRACGQYHQALMNWAPGEELLAISHLYMGIEAITNVVLRRQCTTMGIDKPTLASQLAVTERDLPAAVRRKFIFMDDDECYREAKRASDGFEHGYLAFDELQKIAVLRRNTTATYLRNAIIDSIKPDSDVRDALSERKVAVGAWEIVRNFRGWLVGESDELAAPGQAYPILKWRSKIKKATLAPTGEIHIVPEEEISPCIAQGIVLKPGSCEFWGPETNAKREPIRQSVVGKVTPPNPRNERRERVAALLDDINCRVLEYGTEAPIQTNFAGATAIAIFAECRSQYQASALLIKNGLPNEALVLAHGLFRNVERLRYMAESNHGLSAVLGWIRDFFESQKTSGDQISAPKFGINCGLTADEANVKKQKIEALAASKNVVASGFPASPCDTQVDLELSKCGAWLSQRFVDGYGALMAYAKSDAPGDFGFNNVCEDEEQVAFVAACVSEAILMACSAVGRMFDWPTLDGSERLLGVVRSGQFDRSDQCSDPDRTAS